MTVVLRGYQTDVIERARRRRAAGARKIIIQAPTGSGKTHIACEIIRCAVQKGSRVLFAVHRRRVVKQISDRLDMFGIPHGVIMAGVRPTGAMVQVASRDTILSRSVHNDWCGFPPAELVIVDECHNIRVTGTANEDEMSGYEAILKIYPNAAILGLTATPARSSGHGLGAFFDAMECTVPTSQLVREGWLVPVRCYAPERMGQARRRGKKVKGLAGSPVAWWKKLAEGRPTVVFTSKVEQSQATVEAFTREGIPAAHMDAHTPDDERERIIEGIQNGSILVVSNVGVMVEGVDVPELSCCILLRMAGSYVLYAQAVGRIMRSHPSKKDAVLIDHCLDDETQILTKRGFLGRTEVQDNDEVAGFDRYTNTISWQPILSRIDRTLHAHEDMIQLSGPSVDIRVTGNHRIVHKKRIGPRNHWSKEWRFGFACDFLESANRFKIPVSGVQEAKGVPLTDDELRFIGWYLTDGTISGKRTVVIGQGAHQPWVEDIKSCLKGCGFDYTVRKNLSKTQLGTKNTQLLFMVPKGTCAARPRRGWVKLAPYLDKNLSPLLEDVTETQFEVLLHAIHLGDGYKDRLPGRYRIVTGNQLFADRLQSLCVRRGFRCNITTREVPANQEHCRIKQKHPVYVLNIKKLASLTVHGGRTSTACTAFWTSPILPDERVWCVENPLGTLVVRRRGKVSIVGNSGAVYQHGLPDEDVEWTLDSEDTVDARNKAAKLAGKRKDPIVCPQCAFIYSGAIKCPGCGYVLPKRMRPVETRDELLTEVQRNLDSVKAEEERVRYWHVALRVMAAKGRTLAAARCMWKQKFGQWPPDTLPNNQFGYADWQRPVSELLPQYGPRRATA